MMTRRLLLALALCHQAAGFHVIPSHETLHLMQQAASHLVHHAPPPPAQELGILGKVLHHAPQAHELGILGKFLHHAQHAPPPPAHDLSHMPQELLGKYTHQLAENPLPTKMATGASLAVTGDFIAQKSGDEDYCVRRASSFGVFDMAYRALQHAAFPIIVANCHGQFLSSLIPGEPASNLAAAMEQTLASQLGIVPFLYYPAFFLLTSAVQGLDMDATMTRAKENFLPLMKRNLLFWIPVQFIQFAFVQEDLQIPFLCVCGLAWTFILSISAGSTKGYASEEASLPAIELNEKPTYAMEASSVEGAELNLEELQAETVAVR